MKNALFAGALVIVGILALIAYWRSSGGNTAPSRFTEAQQYSSDAVSPAPTVQDWHIELKTRVIESSNVLSKYAWKLTIQNNSSETRGFQGEIEFFDADGFIVDRSPAYDLSRPDTAYRMRDGFEQLNRARLLVAARSQAEFTGIAYVSAAAAAKVTRTEAKIHKEDENEQPARE